MAAGFNILTLRRWLARIQLVLATLRARRLATGAAVRCCGFEVDPDEVSWPEGELVPRWLDRAGHVAYRLGASRRAEWHRFSYAKA